MPYIVVKNEQSVLSRASPDALLTWEPWKGSDSPPAGAITFDTFSGADKCARMQGGYPLWADAPNATVARYGDIIRGVGERGGGSSVVEVVDG